MSNARETKPAKLHQEPANTSAPAARTPEYLLAELAATRAQLEESRQRADAMLDSLGEGLIAVDEHGAITQVNRYALTALGFKANELVGKWFPGVIKAVDESHQLINPLVRPVTQAITTGQALSARLNYIKKDGSLLPVLVTVAPILLGDKPAGSIEVFRDLTQEQQLEIAKDEFVSLASHQLRTPATGVMTILSMLAAGDFGPLTPIQQKYLVKALDTNNYQLQIIEDLLNAARVDAGKMRLEPERADLAAVLRSAIRDQSPLTHARSQPIRLRAPRRLMASIDIQMVRMVLNNLISNASKYSPAGAEIAITLAEQEYAVTLAVADHGVGIPGADIPRLFAKFSRIDNALSTSAGGTGLGLFLVKNLVELHNGSIDVESIPGQGTTFTIRLPKQEHLK